VVRTRRDQPGDPFSETPWDEVVPGLWIGGHFWTDPAGEVQPAVVGREFDLVISLFTLEGHGPDPQVEHVVYEIPDATLTAGQIRRVHELARVTAQAVRDGRSTLVRCHYGHSRSGLVAAQALVELGRDVPTAVALLRERRSPRVLNNPAFERYLAAGLDTP
jgi:protein-tyrosine phosphatase